MTSRDLLATLIGFPTVSRDSNLALIEFIGDYLSGHEVTAQLFHNEDGSKASLCATIGTGEGGILLSGHTDVVPVDGQDWSHDPFELDERKGNLYGRGAADMKGFIASVLAAVPAMVRAPLRQPIHLAFSYDEEVGCLGVRPMLEALQRQGIAPDLCVIGEPTEMQVATAHKGKTAARCTCHGVAAHSALAPTGLNALYLATDMIGAIRRLQAELVEKGDRDEAYSVPYSTLHVGTMAGGTALNIVPNESRFDFEIRNLPGDDPDALMERLRTDAEQLVAAQRDAFPEAAIELAVFNAYPALHTDETHPAVAMVQRLSQSNGTTKVAFGTEGGLFQKALLAPVLVCGPGSMEQGHKPDEFVSVEQLARCDRFMAAMVAELSA